MNEQEWDLSLAAPDCPTGAWARPPGESRGGSRCGGPEQKTLHFLSDVQSAPVTGVCPLGRRQKGAKSRGPNGSVAGTGGRAQEKTGAAAQRDREVTSPRTYLVSKEEPETVPF